MCPFAGNLVRHFAIICVLLFVVAQLALVADEGVIESTKASTRHGAEHGPGRPILARGSPGIRRQGSVRPNSTALSHGNPLSLDRKESVLLVYLSLRRTESQTLAQYFYGNVPALGLGRRRSVYWFRLPEHPEIPGVRNVSARGVGRSGYRLVEAASRTWLDLELWFCRSGSHRLGTEDLVRSHARAILRPAKAPSGSWGKAPNQSVSQPRTAPESGRGGLATYDE